MNITGKRQTSFYLEEKILEVNIPIKLVRRGGRTRIQTADGQMINTSPTNDTALMRALAQAHTWLQKLEDEEFCDLKALAIHYGQNESYVSRVALLTMLSPSLQEAIMIGSDIGGRTLTNYMDGFPAYWYKQPQ